VRISNVRRTNLQKLSFIRFVRAQAKHLHDISTFLYRFFTKQGWFIIYEKAQHNDRTSKKFSEWQKKSGFFRNQKS